jgi:hypothetical protein
MGNTPTTRRYFEMYNLMGDGAIDVYSGVPLALTVTHPSVIPLGAYNLHVVVEHADSPVRNALVCATGKSDTLVHSSAWTDGSGVVNLPVVTSAPDSIFVTVTGHNLAPYVGMVTAVPGPGPFVTFLKCVVNDSPPGGNGDGVINPGETITLRTWVKNWGQGPGVEVTGVLRSTDSAITVLDSLRDFDTIPAGDSAFTPDSGFRFHVADTCSNGHPIVLSLVCRDNQDSTWTSSVHLSPVTGIEERGTSNEERVTQFLLLASPVPSRGATLVQWQVRTEGMVNVAVFDAAGRRVGTLCNSRLNPGSYSATWRGLNNNGRDAAAGLYFCRVSTPEGSLERKLILTR